MALDAPTALTAPTAPVPLSTADRAVRRALLIRDVPAAAAGDLYGAFSRSMTISALRCLLTYIVIPFVAPLVGVLQGVGPALGLAIGAVAIAFNLSSMRRFFIAVHRWRWGYFAIGTSVIVLLLVMMALDVRTLLS